MAAPKDGQYGRERQGSPGNFLYQFPSSLSLKCSSPTYNSLIFLQFLLNSHGFNLAVDGIFGDAVAAILTAFQQIHNIARVDTHVRESTWHVLIAGRTLREGSKGDAVRAVQTLLKRNGMDVEVTGNFGSKTKAAVKTMQRWRGLTQDGVVGVQTWCAVVGGITPAEMRLEPFFEFGPVVVPE